MQMNTAQINLFLEQQKIDNMKPFKRGIYAIKMFAKFLTQINSKS